MNWARHIVFSSLMACLSLGCTKEGSPDCVSALGETVTVVRPIESFDRVAVFGRVDVVLVEDSTTYVTITHGASQIDKIKTVVSDGSLSVLDENTCKWIRDQQAWPLVAIHYKQLNALYSESAGVITSREFIQTDHFELDCFDAAGSIQIGFIGDSISVRAHTGATDITLKGTSWAANFYNGGYGPIDASGFQSGVAFPHIEGTGDIHVWATEGVYYQIFDWGNVYVHGNPPLVKKWHDEGKGEVIYVD